MLQQHLRYEPIPVFTNYRVSRMWVNYTIANIVMQPFLCYK